MAICDLGVSPTFEFLLLELCNSSADLRNYVLSDFKLICYELDAIYLLVIDLLEWLKPNHSFQGFNILLDLIQISLALVPFLCLYVGPSGPNLFKTNDVSQS